MEAFQTNWDWYNDFEKLEAFRYVQNIALHVLTKRKHITGIGILRNPIDSLMQDPKFQAMQKDSISMGESLAFSALTAEYLVLYVAEIDRKEWRRYVGRSQFPRFLRKSFIQSQSEDVQHDQFQLFGKK